MMFALATALLLLLSPLANAGALELTETNFDESLIGKSSLVMFKAPWCGHCKAMTPAFDEVADLYNGVRGGAQLAFVDCTVQDALCQKYGVTGYPTLKVFTPETPEGKPYEGGRSVDALKTFAEENLVSAKCSAADAGANCDEKEKAFLDKFIAAGKEAAKKEFDRLNNMKAGSMSPELKKWLFKRIAILKEMVA